MIEDMKNMMIGLNQQVNEMDEKFDEISSTIKLLVPKKSTNTRVSSICVLILQCS